MNTCEKSLFCAPARLHAFKNRNKKDTNTMLQGQTTQVTMDTKNHKQQIIWCVCFFLQGEGEGDRTQQHPNGEQTGHVLKSSLLSESLPTTWHLDS